MENKNPLVTMTMDNGDVIQLELYPDIAPNTVYNFIDLVNKKFYDGIIFHRVIPGFMIQAGCPNGIGNGGPGYSIKGEFSNNNFKNDLKHERGVLSMARAQDPDSAGSQFFIMVNDSPHLDKAYAGFGRVIAGQKHVDKIVSLKRDLRDRPKSNTKNLIKTIRIDLKGIKYPPAEKIL